MKEKVFKIGKYIFLVVLLFVPIFGYLDNMCIRIWDEARNATNAYEMVQNGNLIVTYFDGVPDMWNTKPPLLIWCQALMIKYIGLNEIAVRLPSAISTFFTCAVLLFFLVRYFDSFLLGFSTVIVLMTSLGYVSMHSTRFGEYESMVTLFTTASGLCFFLFMEKPEKATYLYFFYFLLSLAVLTKGIVGLLFLPALLLYCVWKDKIVFILKSKHTYLGGALFLFLVLGYYLLREIQNPGYINAVSENELGGRFYQALEGHESSFSFYYDNFLRDRFNNWYFLLPCGLLVGYFQKNRLYKDLTVFLFLMIFIFFMIISYAETKLQWYDVPMYPWMALMVAFFINSVFCLLEDLKVGKIINVNIFPYLFLFLIFFYPYKVLLEKTYLPKEEIEFDKSFFDVSYYLKTAIKKNIDLNDEYLLYDNYAPHLKFYLNILRERGVKVGIKTMRDVKVGDIVFFSQTHTKCENHFLYTIISQNGTIITCKIIGEK